MQNHLVSEIFRIGRYKVLTIFFGRYGFHHYPPSLGYFVLRNFLCDAISIRRDLRIKPLYPLKGNLPEFEYIACDILAETHIFYRSNNYWRSGPECIDSELIEAFHRLDWLIDIEWPYDKKTRFLDFYLSTLSSLDAPAWEPYTVSSRIVNCCLFFKKFILEKGILLKRDIYFLAMNLEIFPPYSGNHVLMNLIALRSYSIINKELVVSKLADKVEAWYLSIINNELPFEGSVDYSYLIFSRLMLMKQLGKTTSLKLDFFLTQLELFLTNEHRLRFAGIGDNSPDAQIPYSLLSFGENRELSTEFEKFYCIGNLAYYRSRLFSVRIAAVKSIPLASHHHSCFGHLDLVVEGKPIIVAKGRGSYMSPVSERTYNQPQNKNSFDNSFGRLRYNYFTEKNIVISHSTIFLDYSDRLDSSLSFSRQVEVFEDRLLVSDSKVGAQFYLRDCYIKKKSSGFVVFGIRNSERGLLFDSVASHVDFQVRSAEWSPSYNCFESCLCLTVLAGNKRNGISYSIGIS